MIIIVPRANGNLVTEENRFRAIPGALSFVAPEAPLVVILKSTNLSVNPISALDGSGSRTLFVVPFAPARVAPEFTLL